MTTRGTCPACFREMKVTDAGVMHRHGWKEGGGRRVGEYGRAWHSGECFGVGWTPFEVSPEGSWAYLWRVVFSHVVTLEAALARYRSRPTLRVNYDWDTGERGAWGAPTRKDVRSFELEPGAKVTLETGTNVLGRPTKKTFNYEYELSYRIKRTERELTNARAHGLEVYDRAVAWVERTLREEKPSGPTVHSADDRNKNRPRCGSKSLRSVTISEDDSEVTCSRCLARLEKLAALRAKREAEEADAESLVAYLREHGTSTAANVKAALGWDTKRFNRAAERERWGERRVTEDRSRPLRYSLR